MLSPTTVLLVALAQEPPPTGDTSPLVYTFSNKTGRLAALVFEDPATENSGRSHHHVVVATEWSGRLRWGQGSQCQGEFSVPVARLVADDANERKAEGFNRPLTASDRESINEHMLGRDQLFVDHFPTLTYKVTGCEPTDGGHTIIRGELTLRGTSRPVALRVKAIENNGQLSLEGEGSITHTDFGFEPYYALFGQRQNQDRMRLTVAVRGRALGADASTSAPLGTASE